jgi:hypothetical protein
MNVGELLRERDRLLGVIEEAKSARHKLKQVNILIAMYGDDPKVNVDAVTPTPKYAKTEANNLTRGLVCGVPECEKGQYSRGLCMNHYGKWHNGDKSLGRYVKTAKQKSSRVKKAA